MQIRVQVESDLLAVPRGSWDALDHRGSPFLRWGFLAALARTGSVGRGTGWSPRYVTAIDTDRADSADALVGAVPCFVKDHGYGEYIFDWSWARASARAGLPYYPKLVVAAPMTPASGARILLRSDLGPARVAVAARLIEAVGDLARAERCSSIHWLFVDLDELELLREAGYMARSSFQYHFANPGYPDFAAFLDTLSSSRRKQFRKERVRARAEIDAVELVPGSELGPDDLVDIDRFYRDTVDRHGSMDYLRPGFFGALHGLDPASMLFARVRRGGRTCAGALYFEDERALYGRYWGSDVEIPGLHFEVACWTGIERCIARALPWFEAGAQGDHKLLRGFLPTATHSAHAIFHPDLGRAVARFLEEERVEVARTIEALRRYAPYREV